MVIEQTVWWRRAAEKMVILTPHAMHPKLAPLPLCLPLSALLCSSVAVWHACSPTALSPLCINIGGRPNGTVVSVHVCVCGTVCVWNYDVQRQHISNPKETRWQWKMSRTQSHPKSAQHCKREVHEPHELSRCIAAEWSCFHFLITVHLNEVCHRAAE